jgi:hypothetical protein
MSIPPHHGISPALSLNATCHFHLHSGAGCPFTIWMPSSSGLDLPKAPQEAEAFTFLACLKATVTEISATAITTLIIAPLSRLS